MHLPLVRKQRYLRFRARLDTTRLVKCGFPVEITEIIANYFTIICSLTFDYSLLLTY